MAMNQTLSNIKVDADIVRQRLAALRPDKAPDPDDIPLRILRKLSEEVSQPPTIIFQKSIDDSVVPEDWKLANVCPIFKKVLKTQAANYRPVSLTSQVGKVFETIIRGAPVDHLEKFHLINDSQHGFRRSRSCLTNLIEFLDIVTRSVDTGDNVDIVYLDFAKAFDKVPHQRLISKLEAHGIKGKVLQWIINWLKERRQRVCLHGDYSGWRIVVSLRDQYLDQFCFLYS